MSALDLAGLTVAVTADRRAGEQIELLTRRGARTLHTPTVRTEALGPSEVVIPVTERVLAHRPHVVVFTTALGIRAWFEAAEAAGLADPLLQALSRADLVITRGPKARGAAATLGITVDWDAPAPGSPTSSTTSTARSTAGASSSSATAPTTHRWPTRSPRSAPTSSTCPCTGGPSRPTPTPPTA